MRPPKTGGVEYVSQPENRSPLVQTYRSQQHQADILQGSSAGAAAHQAGEPRQAAEGYAGKAADPGRGEGQDRDHYLLGWS
jgi:hypothetical protein